MAIDTVKFEVEKVTAKTKMSLSHPLIEQTRKNINKLHLDKGCIRTRREGLDIRVSPNNLDRALNIMNLIIKKLTEKKIEITIKEKGYKNATCVVVSGETFAIDIYEKINIIKKGRDRYGFNEYDYIPNGRLVLRIKNAPHGIRSEWKDGQRKKLENVLDKFIEGLYKAAAREKELKREREQWQEEYRKKEEQQRLEEIEQERFKLLQKEAMAWQTSQIIKAYIEAATKAYIEKNGNPKSGSEFDKWRAWAIQRSNQLNPLLKST